MTSQLDKTRIELLVLDAQSGQEDAFTELYHYFYQGLIRFSCKISNNHQLSQDAVQNGWLKISKSLKKIQDPRAFHSWIYQLVRWQTLDLLRKSQKEKATESSIEVEDLIDPKPAMEYDAHNLLLTQINQLAEVDRQAIHLFYLEEMTLQEISIILETPIGTIKSRLNRARNLLKKQMTL